MPAKTRKLNISIVGAGRVGSALAVALRKRGHSIVSVVSRTPRSARRLARIVRCKNASHSLADIAPNTSLVIIAVPEHSLDEISRQLAALDGLPFESMFASHTSGSLTSDVLSAVANKGVHTFSLHPIQSFPPAAASGQSDKILDGIWYGFEGPSDTRIFAKQLTKELGGRFLEVPKDKKILYHLACVFASNYPLVLLGAVERLARQVTGRNLAPFRRLFESSATNGFQLGAAQALTGPLTRGSVEVIHRHMIELSSKQPDLLALYGALGLSALDLLGDENLTPEQRAQLEAILSGNDDR